MQTYGSAYARGGGQNFHLVFTEDSCEAILNAVLSIDRSKINSHSIKPIEKMANKEILLSALEEGFSLESEVKQGSFKDIIDDTTNAEGSTKTDAPMPTPIGWVVFDPKANIDQQIQKKASGIVFVVKPR